LSDPFQPYPYPKSVASFFMYPCQDGGLLLADLKQMVKYDPDGNPQWLYTFRADTLIERPLNFHSTEENGGTYSIWTRYKKENTIEDRAIVQLFIDKKTGQLIKKLEISNSGGRPVLDYIGKNNENYYFSADQTYDGNPQLIRISKDHSRKDTLYLNGDNRWGLIATWKNEMLLYNDLPDLLNTRNYENSETRLLLLYCRDCDGSVLYQLVENQLINTRIEADQFVSLGKGDFLGLRGNQLFRFRLGEKGKNIAKIEDMNWFERYPFPPSSGYIYLSYEKFGTVALQNYQGRTFVIYSSDAGNLKIKEYDPQKNELITIQNLRTHVYYQLVNAKISPQNGDLYIAAHTFVNSNKWALVVIKIPFDDLDR
jgi:hypothetical protein